MTNEKKLALVDEADLRDKHVLKLVDDFEFEGRRCVVVQHDRKVLREYFGKTKTKTKAGESLTNYITESLGDHHNGYVSLYPFEKERVNTDTMTSSREINFKDNLSFHNKELFKEDQIFIGFDSDHYMDTNESKSFEGVKKSCKEIANELNSKMELLDYKKLLDARRKRK